MDKNIKQAVKDIPGLIYDEVHKKQSESKTAVYESPHHSRTWLWTGVIIFSLCIVILWGLNITTVIYETKNTTDPTIDIIENSKQDLQNVVKTFGEQDKELLEQTATTTAQTTTTTPKDEQTTTTTTFLEKLTSFFATTTTSSSTP